MYLLPKKRRAKAKAHIWDESLEDTYCRMASTGGLNKDNYLIHEQSLDLPVCQMCSGQAEDKFQRSLVRRIRDAM